MRTLDYRGYHYDESVDVVYDSFQGPVIFLLWHEYVPASFYLRSRNGLGILASRHRDAEWLSQMATMNGFQVFRGSSGRGGVGVLKAIVKAVKAFINLKMATNIRAISARVTCTAGVQSYLPVVTVTRAIGMLGCVKAEAFIIMQAAIPTRGHSKKTVFMGKAQ